MVEIFNSTVQEWRSEGGLDKLDSKQKLVSSNHQPSTDCANFFKAKLETHIILIIVITYQESILI